MSGASIARLGLTIGLAAILAGCAAEPPSSRFSTPTRTLADIVDQPGPVTSTSSQVLGTQMNPIAVYDPFEATNRAVFKFNAQFDRYVFIPVVDAYTAVTPRFARDRVSNVILNFQEIITFGNSLLQWKVDKAVGAYFRFILNSTIGLFGMFDPAAGIGIPRRPEDFGQTLGVWGVKDGPYIVLPFLGPSNARDTTGVAVDLTAEFALLQQLPSDVRNNLLYDVFTWGLWPIDARYRQPFRYHQTGSPFEYDLVRYFITQQRRLEIGR